MFLSFRIFEQLAIALKIEFALNSLYWIYIFYNSGFLSNMRLPWKHDLHWIHSIEYIFLIIEDFWATCTCSEKHELPWNVSLYWIYIFHHSGFLSNLRLPWKTRVALISFSELKYFYHSRFLSNLRLPWKIRVALKCSLYWNIFIIQDLWATCACPESRPCIEITVLNIYFSSFRICEQLALAL